jgi:tetratricopeptide (TPR) repeat protein
MMRSLPIAAGLLTLFTAIAYLPALGGGFVFDDGTYIVNNRHVVGGLTQENVRWAFTTLYGGNWHPLTWLSHMLDAHLFGLRPLGHHLVNVLFHLANSILLLWVLYLLTGALVRSLFVAALFALHPLHVESVAWVAERKDVLSTCFFLLSLWAYHRYVGRPGALRYAGVLTLFLLGLMSKSMVVTFPFVLLLLDWWPLGRFGHVRGQVGSGAGKEWRQRLVRLFVEKIPLLVLSAAVAAVSFFAQRGWGAMTLESIAFPIRLANALVTYLKYMYKLLLPINLAVFYPHPGADLPVWKAVAAFLVLTGITLFFLKAARIRPFLTMGWFWYLGMLVPVIGLVQVGSQAMADRYTYLPSIGLFVSLVWTLYEVVRRRQSAVPLFLAATLLASVYGALTWTQTRYWRDGLTLFGHAAASVPESWLAHNNYGHELMAQNSFAAAADEFALAVQLRPGKPGAHYNLALAFEALGRRREAIEAHRKALRLDPGFVDARLHIAILLAAQLDFDEADRNLREALRVNPGSVEAHFLLADLLAKRGRHPEAIARYREVLRLRPDLSDAYLNAGNSYSDMGREDDAIAMYQMALRTNPASDRGHFNTGLSLERLGRYEEAAVHFRRAMAINPRSVEVGAALERVEKHSSR